MLGIDIVIGDSLDQGLDGSKPNDDNMDVCLATCFGYPIESSVSKGDIRRAVPLHRGPQNARLFSLRNRVGCDQRRVDSRSFHVAGGASIPTCDVIKDACTFDVSPNGVHVVNLDFIACLFSYEWGVTEDVRAFFYGKDGIPIGAEGVGDVDVGGSF